MRLSGYRIMWLFVFFDLPTNTKLERYSYSQFRKFLLKQGFDMKQYSVYMRHTTSREQMDVLFKTVERNLPKQGEVSVMQVTDKQFGMIKNFYCREAEPPLEERKQIMMF